MPRTGHGWCHVMWHTYGTWLHGDPRGFRDRYYRIHSSGDYRNPPPLGEHAGLHRYMKRISDPEVILAISAQRQEVCQALAATVEHPGYRLLVIAVCKVHVHLVVELPLDTRERDRALREIKTRSSARVKSKPTSRLWARKWTLRDIDTPSHRTTVFKYVRDRQGRYACVWVAGMGIVKSG
jgi:REP element-mobilizing transposase RayT